MTSQIEQEAANVILPLLNTAAQPTCAVIATSVASARTNLAALLLALPKGHFITILADGAVGEDIAIAFTQSDAGAIDETVNGSGVTACQVLRAGERISGRLPGVDSPNETAYTWLVHKAKAGTPKLRINISSIGNSEDVRALRA